MNSEVLNSLEKRLDKIKQHVARVSEGEDAQLWAVRPALQEIHKALSEIVAEMERHP